MTTRRQRGRNFPPEVLARIAELARLTVNAAEIRRQLLREFGDIAAVPAERTVRNIVGDYVLSGTPEYWTLAQADAADAMLVLPVLAAVIKVSAGARHTLSVTEADWIVCVRRAAPDLPPFGVWQVAGLYEVRQSEERETADLDALLALVPWTGPAAWATYDVIVQVGAVERPPLRWAMAASYLGMLRGLGFSGLLIDEVGPDYQRLVQMQAELDATGKAGGVKKMTSLPDDMRIIKEQEESDGD